MPIRLLADMGVSSGVVQWLRAQGYDAFHLRERLLQRSPDPAIFDLASHENRVILTFDLDFGEILALSQSQTSVILFRLNNTRTPFVINRLQDVLVHASAALEQGAVVVVEDWRFRVRRLPLGS